jgi:hypothetical protein
MNRVLRHIFHEVKEGRLSKSGAIELTRELRTQSRSRLNVLAHPTRFERVTFAFGGRRISLIAFICMCFSSIHDAILIMFVRLARTFCGHHLSALAALWRKSGW